VGLERRLPTRHAGRKILALPEILPVDPTPGQSVAGKFRMGSIEVESLAILSHANDETCIRKDPAVVAQGHHQIFQHCKERWRGAYRNMNFQGRLLRYATHSLLRMRSKAIENLAELS